MSKRAPLLLLAGVTLPLALVVGWWLVSPLFITVSVDEPFPTGMAASAPMRVESSATPMPAATATVPKPTATREPAKEEMVTDTTEAPEGGESEMEEAAPAEGEAMAEGDAGLGDESAPESVMTTNDSELESAAPEVMVTFPQVERQGAFYPIVHAGEGTATVYLLEDGTRTLRFEEFLVDNGPDLSVWLVPQETVPGQIGIIPEEYYDLGELKGNEGNQNYTLPADLDLRRYKSVVVWCVAFSVPFAAAPLEIVTP